MHGNLWIPLQCASIADKTVNYLRGCIKHRTYELIISHSTAQYEHCKAKAPMDIRHSAIAINTYWEYYRCGQIYFRMVQDKRSECWKMWLKKTIRNIDYVLQYVFFPVNL